MQRDLDTLIGRVQGALDGAAATEERSHTVEERIAEADERADAAVARANAAKECMARRTQSYEQYLLKFARDAAASKARHARDYRKGLLFARAQLERAEHELHDTKAQLDSERTKCALLETFKAHADSFIGPPPRAATGAHCWTVEGGRRQPTTAHRARLARVTRYLEDQLGGKAAVAYEVARRATRNQAAINLLDSFARYNSTMQRRFDRACQKASTNPKAAERAAIGKVHVGLGARKMEQINNEVMDGHVVDVGAHLQLRHLKVKLSRGRLRGALKRLIARYGYGGSAPIARYAPKIEPVFNSDGKKIGAFADTKAAHILAAIAVLESEQLQQHYEPLFDARARSLGEHHIGLIHGWTRDLFPLNKRASVTQMSGFNSKICSASNSPHQQHPGSFSRAKEDDELMHLQYARVDGAHAELRASALADGEPVELTPPRNAKYCPPHMRGKRGTFFLHFRNGHFEVSAVTCG